MAEVINLERLASLLKPRDRLIGADLGTKTIGLALSDVERRLASPLETIKRSKFSKDAARIIELMGEFEAAALVIG